MAIEYRTKRDQQKVYNARGAHIATIQNAGTVVTVSGAVFDVDERGSCFPISSPQSGFVPVGDLVQKEASNPPPLPPPPPPSGEKPIYITAHYVDGSTDRYVPE